SWSTCSVPSSCCRDWRPGSTAASRWCGSGEARPAPVRWPSRRGTEHGMHTDQRALPMENASFDRLLGELYDAAMDDHSWSRYLMRLQQLFKANYVTLILRIPQDSDKGLMMVIGDIEGQGSITYITYPRSETPFINCPINQVFTVTDLMSLDSWRASDYYQ